MSGKIWWLIGVVVLLLIFIIVSLAGLAWFFLHQNQDVFDYDTITVKPMTDADFENYLSQISERFGPDRPMTREEIASAFEDLFVGDDEIDHSIYERLTEEDQEIVREYAKKAFFELKPAQHDAALYELFILIGDPYPPEVQSAFIDYFKQMEGGHDSVISTLITCGTEKAAQALIEFDRRKTDVSVFDREYVFTEASNKNRLTPEFIQLTADYLAQLSTKEPALFVDPYMDYSGAWMILDSERAIDFLTSPPYWDTSHEEFPDIVYRLRSAAAKVPEERLLVVEKQLRNPDHPFHYRHLDIVYLLARIKSPQATKLINSYKGDSYREDDVLASEAALRGFIQPYEVVDKYLATVGYDASPDPIKHLWAMRTMNWEVNNGGMHQYFFNSAGDIWPDLYEGLKAARFDNSVLAFDKVLRIFGDTPPSTDREVRWEQLDQLSKGQEQRLYRLGDQFQESLSEYSLWSYIMSHPEIFAKKEN